MGGKSDLWATVQEWGSLWYQPRLGLALLEMKPVSGRSRVVTRAELEGHQPWVLH